MSTAFSLSTATYNSINFNPASQTTTAYGISFGDSGTKLYVTGTNEDSVFQYNSGYNQVTNTFDVSTGNYFADTPSVSAQYDFSNAGDTQTWQLEVTGNQAVVGYDLANAAYDSVSFYINEDALPIGLRFNNDGTKLYVLGNGTKTVYQYTLSTAFDLSTASYDSVSFSISSQDTSPHDIVFNTDGTKMYMIGTTNDSIFQYTLSTAFDLSTASYDSVSFSISSQDTSPSGMAFNNDGTKLYMVGYVNDRIFQYTTATSTAITITWDSSIKWAGGTAPDSPANGEKDLYTITTDDAGTSYVGIQSGDNFS
jgi:hypothetical protein